MKFLETKTRKYYKNSELQPISNLKGYYVFPTFMLLCVYGYLMSPFRMFFGLLSFFYGLRIILTKQRYIIWSTLCLTFLFSVYLVFVRSDVGYKKEEKSISRVVLTYPDTLTIRGKYLTAIVQDNENRTNHFYLRMPIEELPRDKKKLLMTTVQKIKVFGQTSPASSARNRDGFDFNLYLKDQGVSGIIEGQSYEWIAQHSIGYVGNWRELRSKLAWWTDMAFHERTASYIKRLIIGMKDDLYKQERDSFSDMGILHFFSISGLHVYFFLTIVSYLLKRAMFTEKSVLVGELLFLVFFILITGQSISVIRAALYVIIRRVNQLFGTYLTKLDCWSLTIWLGIVLRPFSLLTAGGQLTFYFTFLLILIEQYIPSHYRYWARELCSMLWITILSVPLLVYHFYQWNILSTLLTLILSPLFGYLILPLLLVSMILAYIAPLSSSIWLNLLESGLTFFYKGIDSLSSVQGLRLLLGKPSIWLLAVYLYVGFVWLSRTRKGVLSGLKILIIMLTSISLIKYLQPFGTVAVLDVGQGDCLVIHPPFSTKATLVDTGGKLLFSSTKEQSKVQPQIKHTLLPFLKSRGITTIETLFMTHADADHVGDVPELVKELAIEKVVYPKGFEQKNLGRSILHSFSDRTKKIAVVSPYKIATTAGDFRVLGPIEAGQGDNYHSLVLSVEVGGYRWLLTGDLDTEGEREIMKNWSIQNYDILKVGHHGSRSSTSEQWLSSVFPKYAVISCGKNNRYGHPHREVLKRIQDHKVQLFRTDQQGMIYYDYMTLFPYRTQIKTMIE